MIVCMLKFVGLTMVFCNGCSFSNNRSPNNTIYFKDDIILEGYISLFGNRSYKYVQFGKYKNISTDFPDVYLLFDNGEKVFLPDIDIEWIKQKKQKDQISYEMKRAGCEYGELLMEYNINDCSFFFRDNKFLVFNMSFGLKAIISKEGNRYDLPLSYDKAVELFGKEDRIKDYFGK